MAIRIPSQPTQSLHRTGDPYPLEVVHDAWRICADTSEEILGLLIDGYLDHADEQERLLARFGFALRARVMVQALLNAGEPFDQGTEEEIQVLLDRSDTPPAIVEWRCAIPLVLITIFYQPIGELPQPHTFAPGQIWWIDPSTAHTLLETLHQVRFLDLRQASRSATSEDESKAYRNLGTNGAAGYRWRSASRADWPRRS